MKSKHATFTSRTSWREKLEKPQEARLEDVPPAMQRQLGPGKMLIPRPLDVDALIRTVARGRLVTMKQLRKRLAEQHAADVTCPLTTGIFVRIAAETAQEDLTKGRKRITPYWRVLGEGGRLNQKFPGGAQSQAARLRAEGHLLEPSGKHAACVRDFERKLVRW
jgi:hypothetical protein